MGIDCKWDHFVTSSILCGEAQMLVTEKLGYEMSGHGDVTGNQIFCLASCTWLLDFRVTRLMIKSRLLKTVFRQEVIETKYALNTQS